MSRTQQAVYDVVLHATGPLTINLAAWRSGFGYDATRDALTWLETQGLVRCERAEQPFRWSV